MRSAQTWISGIAVALLAGPLWAQLGGTAASVATVSASTRVHFDMTAAPVPPSLTPEQLVQRDRGPLPHATPLPDGTSAVSRPIRRQRA